MALENLTQITSVGISTGITFSGVTTHTGTIKGTDADFTGNVSVGGTLTYEDVKNIDSVGIITARGGIFLPDNKKVQLGNVSGTADFEIAHDTNNTVIQNRTGALYFKGIGGSGNNIIIEAKNNENSARFLPDGACELYFNGAKTVETTVNALHLTGNTAESNITCKTSDGTTRGILGVTNSNSVTLYSGSSTKALEYASNALTLYHTGNAKLATASTGVEVTGVIKLNQTQSKINLATSDGSDNKYLSIGGGGDASQSRGAGITLYGNEVSSQEGRLQILAGNSGSANGVVQMHTGGAERLRIDSSGRLLITSTTSRTVWGANPQLQIEKLDSNAAITVIRNQNNAGGPWLALCKSRGTSNGAVTIVQDGDSLGSINWFGADGVDLASTSAEIRAEIDGTPGENDLPGRIIFKTTADGASSATERLRIGSDGILTVSSESVVINRNAGDPYFAFQTSGASNAVIYGGASTGLRGFTKPSGGSLTERLRIDPVGMTGLRTTVPRATLHVKAHDNNWEAGLLLENNTNSNGWNIHPESSDNTLMIGYNDDVTTSLAGQTATNVVRITSAGRVGINEGSPDSMLHIKANNDRSAITLENTYDSPDNVWELNPGISGVANTGFCIRDVTDSANRLVIDGSGKVGLNVNAPDLRLHVNGTNALPATTGSTAAGHLCLRDKTGSASHGLYMGVSHQAPWSSWIQAQDGNALGTEYPLLLNPNGGGIIIGNTAATFGSSTLAIEKTSNTIGPRINLYNGASGQAAATCEIHVGQNYRDANRIIFGRENNNNWQSGASGAASYMSIHTNSAGTVAERFRISSGGIVTRPYHSAFKAVGTAGWLNFANGWNSLGGSASGTINPGFNTTDYNGFDNQNEFNETNGRFVATVAGDYYFWYMMYIKKNVATQSQYIHINPYVNDSNRNAYTIYGRQQAITNGTHIDGATGGWAGALAAGDYFNWYVYCDGANNFQVYGGHCVMGGWLIG